MKTASGSRGVLSGVIVVALVLLLVVVGFRFVRNRSLVSAAVIGDSITDQGRPVLADALGDEYAVDINGVGGARVDQMEGEADKLAATHPQQLVINLGTNDVVGQHPVEESMKSYERVIAKFPDTRCLHVVTINENIFSPADPDLKNRTIDYNTRLRALASKFKARVIDWAAIVRDYLAAGEPEGHLSNDTIHPTEMGQHKLADAYRSSLDACRNAIL